MSAEPGHEMAAYRGGLRSSRAEREQAVEVLKAAFVQGRLAKDEFDTRVGQAFTSRTRAELAAVTADLPAGAAADRSARQPGRAQTAPPANPAARNGARVIAAVTALAAASWAGAGSGPSALMLAWTFTISWLGILIFCVALMLECRRQDRSGGQVPPRGTDGRTSLGY